MKTSQETVALFIASMRGGGAERVTSNLAQAVAREGYNVDLVLARAEGPYLTQIPKGIRIIDFRSSQVLSSLPALVHYLRREQPVAMLSVMDYVNITALWARHLASVTTRLVVSEHNTVSQAASHATDWRGRLMPRMIRRFYPWADGIVAVSKGVADDLAHATGLPRSAINVIYNPVITPELQEKLNAPLSHPWFMPGQPPVLLAVGRLTIVKDFSVLVQAFAKVRRIRPARLLILGEGRERPTLEALVKKLDLERDVSMPGFVENPYAFMAQAAVFVLSSRCEALPTALIEALYCRSTIVATDCPGGVREVLQNGRYGQLVPPGDAAALAEAIEKKLDNPGPSPSQESWLPFTTREIVRQYLNMILGVS
jgi:glycosyltransferase involved in cell wall biosynthesis